MNAKLDVTIVGGGMITNDLNLPSVYHLQREEVVGRIGVCALNTPPLRALKESAEMRAAFPGQDFISHPDLSVSPEQKFPELFKEVIRGMRPRQAVIVALPDPLHHGAVMAALKADQHVLCVKPLVLSYDHAEEVRDTACAQGLFVGVEYHKRFDRRSLMARRQYLLGTVGEFRMGEAKMIEPYLYRHSNFYGLYASRTKGKWTDMPHVMRLAPAGWKAERLQASESIRSCYEEKAVSDQESRSTWARLIAQVYEGCAPRCPLDLQ